MEVKNPGSVMTSLAGLIVLLASPAIVGAFSFLGGLQNMLWGVIFAGVGVYLLMDWKMSFEYVAKALIGLGIVGTGLSLLGLNLPVISLGAMWIALGLGLMFVAAFGKRIPVIGKFIPG